MPQVVVLNRSRTPVRGSVLARAARAAIRAEGRDGRKTPVRVVIAVVDDAEMRSLHRMSTGKRSTTDVLAWPMARSCGKDQIAVCAATARREAARRGHAFHAELALYIVHGILHLAGHDDHAPRARRRMWDRQAGILLGLGVRLRS